MPFNPCGRLVDYARREYRTSARLFRDSSDEVAIQWYRVPDDAPTLPYPSAVMSLDWVENGYDEPWKTEVGEVWRAARPYSFHGELIAPNYDHVCGTAEDHAEGAAFDPELEVQYDEQGLPLCCGQPAVPMMGVEIGFDAVVPQVLFIGGATCEVATELPVDVLGETGALATGEVVWAELVGHATGDYRFTFGEIDPPRGQCSVHVGASCVGSSLYFLMTDAGDYDVPLDAGQRYFLAFIGTADFSPMTIRVSPIP